MDLFRQADVNEDGEISMGEFRSVIARDKALNASEEELRELYVLIDADGSDSISFKELNRVLAKARGGGGGGGGCSSTLSGMSTASNPLPNGYAQAVGRMRRAGEEREALEVEEAEKARKRAAQAGKPPKPFDLLTDKRGERRHPLLYMDVNLGPGRSGRIGLHEGDDPATLAANFARAYGLDATMQVRLTALVEKYMNEVVPELASGKPVDMPGLVLPSSDAGGSAVDVTDT